MQIVFPTAKTIIKNIFFKIIQFMKNYSYVKTKRVLTKKGMSRKGGSIISRKNLNEYIGTLHLPRTQFYHRPSFHCKTGFLRNHPLSFGISGIRTLVSYQNTKMNINEHFG